MTPNDRLLASFRKLSSTERQNRLMRIGDREIAMAMMYMKDPDRALLVGAVGAEKARRIRAELDLQRRLAIRYDDYLAAVTLVVRNLQDTSKRAVIGSYIRPRTFRKP